MKPPTHRRVVTATRRMRTLWIFAAVPLAAFAAAPSWADRGTLHLLSEFSCILALAQMWNLVAGYGGMVSIGHQAFVGIGGYALFAFALQLGGNPFLGVVVAGVVAGAVSLVVAPVVFRLRHAYFAIGTWVVAEVFRLLVANTPALGGGSGTSLTNQMTGYPAWLRESLTFWLAAAVGIGSTLAVYLLLRSRFGLGLTALRDDEIASESVGVRVRSVRLLVFVMSAVGCGMTGALVYLSQLRISPDAAFSVEWSAAMIFIVVIGGIGTIEGPVVGTVVYLLLRGLLADYGSWYLIALGAIGIAVMVRAPKGIWGLVASRFDFHLFPVQRRVVAAPESDAAGIPERLPAAPVLTQRAD